MEIKKRLQILIDAGFSQREIADQLGIAQSTVSDLYRGRLKSLREEVGKKLDALCLVHKVEQVS
jgi:predicted XRE-type DNA-binding protein